MNYAVYPKREVTIDLEASDVELCDSGVRPIAFELPSATLARFEVSVAGARLPTGPGGAIDIGLVEVAGASVAVRRRILIRVWLRAETEGQYAVGSGALFMLGEARRAAPLDEVAEGRVMIVKVHPDRVMGAFELDLEGTLLHGTFCARVRCD
jgi:hypothetical protein